MPRKLMLLALAAAVLAALALAPLRAEEAPPARPAKIDVAELFPDTTILLFEVSPAVASLFTGDRLPAPALRTLVNLVSPELVSGPPCSLLPAFLSLPWKSGLGVGRLSQGGVLVLAGELDGDASAAVERLLAEGGISDFVQRSGGEDYKVFTVPGRGGSLYILTLGGRIAVSSAMDVLKPFVEHFRNPGGFSFADKTAWALLDPMEPGTLVRGVLDVPGLAAVRPFLVQVFQLFGVPDLECVTYRLSRAQDGTLRETLSADSAAPFSVPFSLFSLSGPLGAEDSIVPDTAVLSLRLRLNVAELGAWFVSFLDTVGGGGVTVLDGLKNLGFPDLADFFRIFGDRIECFFDYPRGVVLPEYVLTITLADEGLAADTLSLFAESLSLPSVERGGVRFWYVPARDLPRDFPWGLCFGILDGRLVVASNLDRMTAAFARAKKSPLVALQRYKKAFASLPSPRSAEIYLDPAAMTGLMNLLSLSHPRRAEKALFPSFSGLKPLGGALAASDSDLTFTAAGPAVPVAAIWFEGLMRFGRRVSGVEEAVLRGPVRRMRAMRALVFDAYRKGRAPTGLYDICRDYGRRAVVLLFDPAALKRMPDPVTADYIRENALFFLVPIPGDDPRAAIRSYAKGSIPGHDSPPLLIYREPVAGKILTFTVAGKPVAVPAEPERVKNLLDAVNAWAGTSFRFENGRIVR